MSTTKSKRTAPGNLIGKQAAVIYEKAGNARVIGLLTITRETNANVSDGLDYYAKPGYNRRIGGPQGSTVRHNARCYLSFDKGMVDTALSVAAKESEKQRRAQQDDQRYERWLKEIKPGFAQYVVQKIGRYNEKDVIRVLAEGLDVTELRKLRHVVDKL